MIFQHQNSRVHASVTVNPLDSKAVIVPHRIIRKLVHWPLMGGLLHLVQRGGTWAGCGSAQSPPCWTKCDSPPITVLLYYGPLLCGFNVAIRGLIVEAPEFSHATQVKRLKKCIQYKITFFRFISFPLLFILVQFSKKNSDSVRNEFGSVWQNTIWFRY